MNFKTINNFSVHPVGIGTWLMGGGNYPDKTAYVEYGGEDVYIKAIQYSIEHGQNHIDTAMSYGLGHTEEIVGKAIHIYNRSSLFIASKLWKSHLKGAAIQKAIEGMLTRLQIDYLDLVYLHGYWDEYEPLASQLKGLNEAVDLKLIRSIGVSNFNIEQLNQAMKLSKHPIAALQNYYTISNRTQTSQTLLSLCSKEHIAFVTAKPLERGALLVEPWKSVIEPIAKKYNATISQIALAWLLNQENVHVIPKAVSESHIDENIKAADIQLSTSDLQLLTQAQLV